MGGPGVRGFWGSRGLGVRGSEGLRVQGSGGSGVPEVWGSGVPEARGSRGSEGPGFWRLGGQASRVWDLRSRRSGVCSPRVLTGAGASRYALIDVAATEAAHRAGAQHAQAREERLPAPEQRPKAAPR